MTFKQWLRQIEPSKANQLDTLVAQAERQREIDEDVYIDEHFNANANQK